MLSLIAFVLLIGGWLYSAWPMVGNVFKTVSVVGGDSVVDVQATPVLFASVPDQAAAARGREEHAAAAWSGCELELKDKPCTVENVRALSLQTGCEVKCGN